MTQHNGLISHTVRYLIYNHKPYSDILLTYKKDEEVNLILKLSSTLFILRLNCFVIFQSTDLINPMKNKSLDIELYIPIISN